MADDRTHRPELQPERCGICRICLSGCPGRVLRDISTESDTIRGRLSGEQQKLEEQPPCQLACPIAQDIPGYLNRIAAGDSEGAIAWILRENPFPAVLGHICHHPCEQACISGSIQQPPLIRELKRFASMAKRPAVETHSGAPKGRVAVIGAGPAGLASAWALSRGGVEATVYEGLSAPGGLLAWAIPPFRLPQKAVRADIDYILQHKVNLQLNRTFHPEEVLSLQTEYDAVVLACGASTPKQTDIPGSGLPGVWLGLDFLRRAALGPAPELIPPVAIIGGGNVATDSARWALRMTQPVTIVYRRDREDMPAYADEVEASESEGIQFLYRSQPVGFEGGPQKGVRKIRLQTTIPGPAGEDGRRSFTLVPRAERTIPAGTVILALGQEKDLGRWTEAMGIRVANPSEAGFLTDRIYAAGDVVTGPATIVEAVAGGMSCARRILREVFA